VGTDLGFKLGAISLGALTTALVALALFYF
jgi:hypothetical protein